MNYLFGSSGAARSREVEIALTDVFVSSRYRNLTQSEGWFELLACDRRSGQVDVTHRHTLSPGFYADPAVAAKQVSGLIQSMTKPRDTRQPVGIELVYDQRTQRTRLKFNSGARGLRLGKVLARLWGFV